MEELGDLASREGAPPLQLLDKCGDGMLYVAVAEHAHEIGERLVEQRLDLVAVELAQGLTVGHGGIEQLVASLAVEYAMRHMALAMASPIDTW